MIFHRINRTNPEKTYVIVKNSWSTASLTNGQVAAWDYVTDKDGIAVTKPSALLRHAMAGVAIATIATGDFGLLQVWGHHTAIRMSGGSGNNTSKITAGDALYLSTSGFALNVLKSVASTVKIYPRQMVGPLVIAAGPTNTAAKATSATTWVGTGFIKCL